MALNQSLQYLSGNNNLQDTSVEYLAELVSKYPYFAPTQFLLALKQKQENSFSYNSQIQKSALYFSNSMWLQYQLQEIEIAEPVLQSTAELQEIKNAAIPDEVLLYKSATPLTKAIEPSFPNYSTIDSEEDEIVFEPVHFQEQEITATTIEADNIITNKKDSYNEAQEALEEHKQNTNYNNSDIEVPTLEAVKRLLEDQYNNTSIASPIIEPEKIEVQPVAAINILEEPIATPNTTIPNYKFQGFKTDNNIVTLSEEVYDEAEEAEAELEIPNNNISNILSTQALDFKKPIEDGAKLDFESEPYYTVDYFASQGIKIDLTKQPQDKLTIQLRRFTDWLKQMKTTDPNPRDLGTDPELEKAIQNIAKTSIESREIVTETMADVFIKQGKVDKAIQLYIKLSFLDPLKSTYFANKIQQLKGI